MAGQGRLEAGTSEGGTNCRASQLPVASSGRPRGGSGRPRRRQARVSSSSTPKAGSTTDPEGRDQGIALGGAIGTLGSDPSWRRQAGSARLGTVAARMGPE